MTKIKLLVVDDEPLAHKVLEGYCEKIEFWTKIKRVDQPDIKLRTNKIHLVNEISRTGIGLLFADKKHFIKVGGYNSDLVGWGWEDVDILLRMQMICNIEHKSIGYALHLADIKSNVNLKLDREYSYNIGISLNNIIAGNYLGTLATDLEEVNSYL